MLSCLKKQSAVYTTTTTTDAVVTAVATVTNYMFDVSTFRRVCTVYNVPCMKKNRLLIQISEWSQLKSTQLY